MFNSETKPGDIVLLCGCVTETGAVRLDNGIVVDNPPIVAEVPPRQADLPWPLVLLFETAGDRAEFAGTFAGVGCVEL